MTSHANSKPDRARDAWTFCVTLTLATRAGLWLTGLGAAWMGQPTRSESSLLAALATLPKQADAVPYLAIARDGYHWGGPGVANSLLPFFPGFPLLLRSIAWLGRIPDGEPARLWLGVGVSTVCLVMAAGTLYALARQNDTSADPDRRARAAAALLLTYPFSVFHGQVYSESLFLWMITAATLSLGRGRVGRTIVYGVAAGLTRPVGCLLVLPLLAMARRTKPVGRSTSPTLALAAAVLSPIAGTALYSAYCAWLTGSPLAWLHDQDTWGRFVVNPGALLWTTALEIIHRGPLAFTASQPYYAVNVWAGLAALVGAAVVYARLGAGDALFVLAGVLLPLAIGGFPSMGRYTAVLFPLFLAAASVRRLAWPLVVTGFALEVLLAVAFLTHRPVY